MEYPLVEAYSHIKKPQNDEAKKESLILRLNFIFTNILENKKEEDSRQHGEWG